MEISLMGYIGVTLGLYGCYIVLSSEEYRISGFKRAVEGVDLWGLEFNVALAQCLSTSSVP